jgi:hypothetical protein
MYLGSTIFLSTLPSNTIKPLGMISKPTNTQLLHFSHSYGHLRDVHYEGEIDQNITEVFEPMHT